MRSYHNAISLRELDSLSHYVAHLLSRAIPLQRSSQEERSLVTPLARAPAPLLALRRGGGHRLLH